MNSRKFRTAYVQNARSCEPLNEICLQCFLWEFNFMEDSWLLSWMPANNPGRGITCHVICYTPVFKKYLQRNMLLLSDTNFFPKEKRGLSFMWTLLTESIWVVTKNLCQWKAKIERVKSVRVQNWTGYANNGFQIEHVWYGNVVRMQMGGKWIVPYFVMRVPQGRWTINKVINMTLIILI